MAKCSVYFKPDQPSKKLKASFYPQPSQTETSGVGFKASDQQRLGSPTLPVGSFDAGAKSVFHQKRISGRKKQSMPSMSGVESVVIVGSPKAANEDSASGQESNEVGAIQPGQNRMTRQQARTMRISQQRILRETSLETVQNNQPIPQFVQQTVVSQNQARNFASEGFSFKSISEQQQPASQGPPQKLVKKVTMKVTNSAVSNLGTVRQSSLTHRQGPILQNGPHTRSKSSAIGADTSIQIPANNRNTSRKSNSRGRGTPQNRLSMVQPQQHLRKTAQKRSFEAAQHVQPQSQQSQQKSCITITSPKDSAGGDLNTSMPIPIQKSHNRMPKDHQTTAGTSRQHNVHKQPSIGSVQQQQQLQGSTTSKAMATPSGQTYQHTRKQSTTKHRSNSKKRGSINSSIRRQIARSPDANQKASSLLNNSIQMTQPQQQMPQTQPTVQSKQSTKTAQTVKLVQQTSTKVAQWSKDPVTAIGASSFSQQHANSVAPGSMQQVSAEQLIMQQMQGPAKQLAPVNETSIAAANSNLVLAISSGQSGNPPPQGHRLTPLINSNKTGRISNERKNRSVLYEATTAGGHEHIPELLKSETRLKDVTSSAEMMQPSASGDSSELLISMLKDGLQKKQQQILTASVNHPDSSTFIMKGNENNLHHQNALNQHAQQPIHKTGSLIDSQIAPPSSFSSFSKQVPSKLDAKRHQSAQKVLRPKNSLPATQPSAEIISQSPTGVRRSTFQHGKSTATVSAAYSQQKQTQVVQMMLKQQSRQPVATVDPVPLQQRLSHNLPHQPSMVSSAQSSRTALDHYLKQALKSNNQMSSRTVNSVQSGITPYEGGAHKRATTAQELVHELYGSQQERQGEMAPSQLGGSSGAKSTITGVTFHDFHPKSSITAMGQPGESKSQMILDKDVQGLSPEPRAEIILSKNQIQRATRDRQAELQPNQIISISKQDNRTQNLQKLKLQQIQQVGTTSQRDATKKVIKSQRMIQNHHKYHAKSFSNAHQGPHGQLIAEPSISSSINPGYIKMQPSHTFSSATQDTAQTKALSAATKSASKVQPNSSKFMVQNWICSADPNEDQQSIHTEPHNIIKKGQTQRPLTTQHVKNLDQRSAAMQDAVGAKSMHARSLFSSEHQSAMPLVGHNGKHAPGVPTFNASMDEQQATQSQRLIVHQSNQHQLSMQQIQQNLKSVHVANDTRGALAGPTSTILRSGRSAKDQQSILQAEQSRQKILGPLTAQNSKHQPHLVTQDHNAYANNAEDYFKKAPVGTKTPAEKPSKKLTKGGAPSGKRTKTGINSEGVSSQPGSSQPLTQSSMETSPQVEKQMNFVDNADQRGGNHLIKTQSAMTMSAAQSIVSQNSSKNDKPAEPSRVTSSTYGVTKSRLAQFVQNPSSAAKSYSVVGGPIPQSSASTATKLKKKKLQSSVIGNSQQMHGLKKASPTNVDELQAVKAPSAQKGEKPAITQSELMRKKNQAKIIGVSSLSMKQQQNLQMQQLLASKKGSNIDRARGTGSVLQRDPDNTVIPASAIKAQINRGSPTRLPSTIHQQMKMMHSNNQAASKGATRAQTQIGVYPGGSKQANEQTYFSHSVKEREGKQSSQKVMKYAHQQVYPDGLPAGATSSFQMSEKRQSQTKLALSRMDGLNTATEARSQTALSQQKSQEGLSQNSRYNLSQPAIPVTDFQASSGQENSQSSVLVQSLILNQQKSSAVSSFQQQVWSPQARYEINDGMPQRHNKANCLEKIDKKLGKNELLLTSQLSTTTSHSSSSIKEEKGAHRSRFQTNQQQQQFLSHCVTFDAHQNSVIGLQATSNLTGPSQFASFSLDNSVKVWSVTTERPTELISNNRAAAVNLPSRVVLKRQIKNQARPSQKLSSFSFFNGQAQQTGIDAISSQQERKRTILVTGSSDKILRLYAMDIPEQPDDYNRMEYMRLKDRGVTPADVMQPALRVTGQHKGIISSITQLPDQQNDLFLTGCSDGVIRMFSLSSLNEEQDSPLRHFEQGNGVQQICAMSENTFLSSGYDNTVRLWDVRAQDQQRLLKGPNYGKLTCLQKYSNGIFASACNDGLVNFWDMRKMQLVKQVEMPSHSSISAIQFAKKRQYMIAAHDHKLSIINISADSATARQQQQQSFTVNTIAEGANPAKKGANQRDHALQTENAWGKGAKITSMVYSEADRKVYTGGFNKKISVWNLHLDNFH